MRCIGIPNENNVGLFTFALPWGCLSNYIDHRCMPCNTLQYKNRCRRNLLDIPIAVPDRQLDPFQVIAVVQLENEAVVKMGPIRIPLYRGSLESSFGGGDSCQDVINTGVHG